MAYKLGSMFDGSGGFPLAGYLCGVEPRWASEVEPYPIAVTRERFPDMKHLGDISKIHGGEVEPVDIITFGSPCQDLSVAGKRAGLKHKENGDEETTRSGLFMEAVRIIKEMRAATNGKYPRFALWENVPGAFSSNNGEDFRIVCEELIKIVEPGALMPPVPAKGWAYADSYIGDGWSLAYRVFDAQYWGVPQRRRRIHLVVDLRGECAREILFEREGLRGYFAQSGETRQGTPADAESSSGADDREGEGNGDNRGRGLDAVTFEPGIARREGGHVYEGVSGTLRANAGDNQVAVAYIDKPVPLVDSVGGQAERGWEGTIAPTLKATHYKCPPLIAQAAGFCTEHSAQARGVGYQEECAPTLRAGVTPAVMYKPTTAECYDARGNGDGQVVNTLTGDHNNRVTDYSSVVCYPIHDQATRFAGKRGDKSDGKGNGLGAGQEGDPMNTLTSGKVQSLTYCLQGNGIDRADTAGCNGKGWKEDTCYTLNTIDRPAVAYCTDVGFFNSLENQSPTLLARSYKDPHLVTYPDDKVRYIVRRLTPIECARLQGFADWWGYIEPKNALTDEEFNFWLEVRNTHAAINGKKVQDYTGQQMLTWYNKLWTDSAEYKMWGNGIALPPALYCMQGIVDALEKPTDEGEDEWML